MSIITSAGIRLTLSLLMKAQEMTPIVKMADTMRNLVLLRNLPHKTREKRFLQRPLILSDILEGQV